MASEVSAPSLLLALPDPCLVAVLQCCAVADQHSLFSAARAHSRLHQAAVLALRSITTVVHEQQQMDDVVLYLSKHGHNANSIELALQSRADGSCVYVLREPGSPSLAKAKTFTPSLPSPPEQRQY
jgi:hypothetical protein